MTPLNPGLLTSNVFVIGILMSAATALLMNLKSIPGKGWKHLTSWMRKKLVYTVRIYQYDELFYILESYLGKNYQQQYKDVEASLEWSPLDQMRNYPGASGGQGDAIRAIHYKQEDNIFFVKYKGKRIVVEKESDKREKATSMKDQFFRKYALSGYRCKAEINEFLDMIFQEHERARPKELVKIRTCTNYGEWELFDDLRTKPLDRTILKSDIKDSLKEDLDEFVMAEEWYNKVGISYKRGYCFYGSPGNGKTTLSLAIASYLNRDINILNISALDNDNALQRVFSNLRKNSILLIEDVDRVFVQRESKQDKVTFSAFLNVLDGAMSKYGVIVIITTNHIEHLDPALLRDGRIDIKIEIRNPDNRMISEYLSLFYQSYISPEEIPENTNLCMATIQEICVRNKNNPTEAIGEITYRIIGKNLVVLD